MASLRPGSGKWPWIDRRVVGRDSACVYLKRADLWYNLWGPEVPEGFVNDWSEWRNATVLWVCDQLAAGRPVRELENDLAALLMYENHYRWSWGQWR